MTVSLGPDLGLPPDPAIVAPKIDPTVSATVSASTEFLYSGSNPIQTGVAPGTIEARRAAVVRGKVLAKDNTPLTGVTITVLNHPEFGQTLSRNDGQFDLAVNGGGSLVIAYTKAGYFKAQRQVSAPPQEFAIADDVILITADPQVSTTDLTSATPVQVARGTVSDGRRWHPPSHSIISSRYSSTHGNAGRQHSVHHPFERTSNRVYRRRQWSAEHARPSYRRPAVTPMRWCLQQTRRKRPSQGRGFSTPLPFYIENFLNFPVGTPVPVGAYNIDQGHWDAYDNGRVIKILSITNGLLNWTPPEKAPPTTARRLALRTPSASNWQASMPLAKVSGERRYRISIGLGISIQHLCRHRVPRNQIFRRQPRPNRNQELLRNVAPLSNVKIRPWANGSM